MHNIEPAFDKRPCRYTIERGREFNFASLPWKLDNPYCHSMPKNKYLPFQQLGEIMHNIEPTFDKRSCKYSIERGRESTARVVVWREFDVPRSYTLEASFSGCSLGQLEVRNQFDYLTL